MSGIGIIIWILFIILVFSLTKTIISVRTERYKQHKKRIRETVYNYTDDATFAFFDRHHEMFLRLTKSRQETNDFTLTIMIPVEYISSSPARMQEWDRYRQSHMGYSPVDC